MCLCLYASVCIQYVCLCPSICLCVCLCVPVCVSFYLSVCIYLSVCLSLSVCTCACMCVQFFIITTLFFLHLMSFVQLIVQVLKIKLVALHLIGEEDHEEKEDIRMRDGIIHLMIDKPMTLLKMLKNGLYRMHSQQLIHDVMSHDNHMS